jgi:hypothetical protein
MNLMIVGKESVVENCGGDLWDRRGAGWRDEVACIEPFEYKH